MYLDTWLEYTEEFEVTKGVIRIRKSKGRQHNGQKKKAKQHPQNIHIKPGVHRKGK